MQGREEFYIGYAPKAPRRIVVAMRLVVSVIAISICLIALTLVFGQGRLAESRFDYGNLQEFEGVIREKPYPILQSQDGKSYSLVGEGKRGADPEVAGLDGRSTKLRGTLIRRGDQEMIEVVPSSITTTSNNPDSSSIEIVGSLTLVGEIVDSKCYLGVMNPGHTKPHRECASLCIRGGVPPLFVVRDARGESSNLWLLTANGDPANLTVLDYVAEPVEISGAVTRQGDRLFLKIQKISRK